MTDKERVCKAICKSGRFETGHGTCSLLCMDQLGDARRDCRHRDKVHNDMATLILKELDR